MGNLMLTAGEATRGLTEVLQDSGEVLDFIVTGVPKVAQLVISEPVLLIGFTIGVGTLVIGMFKSLKH